MERMKRLTVYAIVLVLISGVACAKNYEVTKKAGEFDVLVKIDKNPPVAGDNNVAIEVKDASGKYVTDAKVEVESSMAAMPGMPAMDYKTDAELKGNEYRTKMNLPAAGPWTIFVKIARGDKTAKMSFAVDAK